MNKYLLSILISILSFNAFAQIPNGYYDDAQGLSGAQLKTALFNIIDDHNVQSYGSIWIHFESTDAKPNGKVWDMYSDVPGGTPPYEYNFGDDQCGNYSGEGDCYNREHSFPKSWFNDASPMYSDLFHIVPTDGYVNSKRSNYPYGEVNNASWTSENGCKLGSNSTSGYSGTVFEPIDEYKGDFARIYFYMATRYEDQIANWENNSSNADAVLNGTSYPCYEEWFLDLLLDWNSNDPVSQKEIDRNNAIYDIQNNRNPYVDHPEYVNQVWGGIIAPSITGVDWSPEIPNEDEAVTVSATITDDGSISSAQLKYGFTSSNLNQTVNMSGSANTYSAVIPGQTAGQDVYFRIIATDNESNTSQSAIYTYQVNGNSTTLELPFLEDFNDQTLGVFNQYSVTGAEQYWHNDNYNETYYAKMSNYDGNDNIENEDWMISPAINFNNYSNEIMNFQSAMKDYSDYSTFIYLKYSTNYSGSGNPNNASWTDLSSQAAWSGGDYEWTESGDIDLSSISGSSVYIAFVYESQDGSGKTWQIDDVSITVDETTNEPPIITNIDFNPAIPDENEAVNVSAVITDDNEVSNAQIIWGYSSNNLNNSVNMSHTSDNYTANIPGQAAETIVYFKVQATDNDSETSISGLYQYQVAGNTNLPPQISNVDFTPQNPAEMEEVTVIAIINDDNEVSLAHVLWGYSESNLNNELNMNQNASEFTAVIPGQNADVTVYFKVEAADNENEYAESDVYEYTVQSNSNEAPVISNINFTPSEPNDLQEVTITANITDDGNIEVAEVHYGTSSSQLNQIVDMTSNGNSYSGIIPPQLGEQIIYFQILAIDNESASTYSQIFSYYVNSTQGIQETKTSLGIVIPNPANDFIRIETPLNEVDLLSIYHSTGKKLMEINNYHSGSLIDVSHLKKGYYLIRLQAKEETKILKLLIQ